MCVFKPPKGCGSCCIPERSTSGLREGGICTLNTHTTHHPQNVSVQITNFKTWIYMKSDSKLWIPGSFLLVVSRWFLDKMCLIHKKVIFSYLPALQTQSGTWKSSWNLCFLSVLMVIRIMQVKLLTPAEGDVTYPFDESWNTFLHCAPYIILMLW